MFIILSLYYDSLLKTWKYIIGIQKLPDAIEGLALNTHALG